MGRLSVGCACLVAWAGCGQAGNPPIGARLSASQVTVTDSDWLSGNDEGGVEFRTAQIRRGKTFAGIGAFASANSLSTSTRDLATVSVRGHVYAIGGSDGNSTVATVTAASIDDNGTLGGWTAATSLPAPRKLHAAVGYN